MIREFLPETLVLPRNALGRNGNPDPNDMYAILFDKLLSELNLLNSIKDQPSHQTIYSFLTEEQYIQ